MCLNPERIEVPLETFSIHLATVYAQNINKYTYIYIYVYDYNICVCACC